MQKDLYAKRRNHTEQFKKLLSDVEADYPNIDFVNKNLIVAIVDGDSEEITPTDVAKYFCASHGMSGYRHFAGFGGDWRMIDLIAEEMEHIFKTINYEGLKKEFKKLGVDYEE